MNRLIMALSLCLLVSCSSPYPSATPSTPQGPELSVCESAALLNADVLTNTYLDNPSSTDAWATIFHVKQELDYALDSSGNVDPDNCTLLPYGATP